MTNKIKLLVTVDLDTGDASVKELAQPQRDTDGRFRSTGKGRGKRPVCKFASVCPIAALTK